jgi:hypothetical protein
MQDRPGGGLQAGDHGSAAADDAFGKILRGTSATEAD